MSPVSPQQRDWILKKIRFYFPHAQVYCFGSRHRGDFKDRSDLDLCLRQDSPLDLLRLSQLQEEVAQSDLPFAVDWVDWWRITLEFRQIISQDHEIWA